MTAKVAADPCDNTYCPGQCAVLRMSSTLCCVGGAAALVLLSTCARWPVCTGPVMRASFLLRRISALTQCWVTTTTTSTPMSCATVLNFADNDYSQLASEASVSMAASGTKYQTVLGA